MYRCPDLIPKDSHPKSLDAALTFVFLKTSTSDFEAQKLEPRVKWLRMKLCCHPNKLKQEKKEKNWTPIFYENIKNCNEWIIP